MITFNDFVHKQNLKKATSNIRIYEVLKKIGPDKKVGIYLRDGPFSSDIGIDKLHPSKSTPWVYYINENYFDSYGVVCPKKLSKFIIKRNEHCLYSEYKIQELTNKRDSYCASFCLYILYSTKVVRIDFEFVISKIFFKLKDIKENNY